MIPYEDRFSIAPLGLRMPGWFFTPGCGCCGSSIACTSCNGGFFPERDIYITLSGLVNTGGEMNINCGVGCDFFNGVTYVLNSTTDKVSDCTWRKQFPAGNCTALVTFQIAPFGTKYQIVVIITVQLASISFGKTVDSVDCDGIDNLSLPFGRVSLGNCDGTASTCTVTV